MSGEELGGESRLRRDLDGILEAALDAVDPERLVKTALERAGGAGAQARAGEARVVAVGKAAAGMARGAAARLDDRIEGGLLLLPGEAGVEGRQFPGFRIHRGGHPLPDEGSVRGARAVLELAKDAGPKTTILLLLSGGASALLTLPAEGVELGEVRTVTRDLLDAGADIGELNTVRKHLDRLKGGGLARVAAPATVRGLVLSDVVGDPLDVIASGPVSPDPTTFGDAIDVLRDRRLWSGAPPRVRRHLEAGAAGERPETPGSGDPCFAAVTVEVVGNAETAARAALLQARDRGYNTRLLGTSLTGEARDVGAELGRLARLIREGTARPTPPACIVAAGETTVEVKGEGIGGRNQELALGAAREMGGRPGLLLASLGTDGIDGPTDAAGAIATGRTVERARERGLSPDEALARNDTYPFFRALDDLLVTGPTGTNVMDLQVALVAEPVGRSSGDNGS